MARSIRIEFPGAYYHVMARGNRREAIFHDDDDRRFFLNTLSQACEMTGWRVHAWVLMGNHYHLFIQTPEPNLVAGMKWLQNTYTRRYNVRHRAWGLDLSGTETGAGGVGGLLFVKLHSTPVNNSATTIQPSSTSTLAPCYDGSGNILAYVDCATGQTLARYEYDPFGKLLLKDEDARMAGRLHHQFSTKYTDDETGLSYYGFRYYSPELGRWVSRDPIGEAAGLSLYAFVANDGVSQFDYLGKYTQAELDNMSGTPGFDPGSFNSGYGSPGNFGSPASACGYTSAQLSEILGSMLGGRDAVAYQYGTYDAAIQSLLAQIRANQGMCCQNGQRVPVEPVWKVQGYDSAEECESCNSSWYGRLAAGVADWAIESGAAAGIAYLTGASGGTAIAIGGAVGGVFNAAEIQPFTDSYNDSVDRACLSGVCPQGSTGL